MPHNYAHLIPFGDRFQSLEFLGAMAALQALGARIDEDASFVGVNDDLRRVRLVLPRLHAHDAVRM